MNLDKDLVQKLKQATKTNPVAAAVFYLLALRKRGRATLTSHALVQSMNKEGFKYSRAQYREFLIFLSELGIGTPVYNRAGNCTGLKDIKLNLMDLGKVVTEAKDMVSLAKPIVAKNRRINDVKSVSAEVVLEMIIAGKPATLRFAESMTPQEIASFIQKLQLR